MKSEKNDIIENERVEEKGKDEEKDKEKASIYYINISNDLHSSKEMPNPVIQILLNLMYFKNDRLSGLREIRMQSLRTYIIRENHCSRI